MSECHLWSELYIQDPDKRAALVDTLKTKTLTIADDVDIYIEECDVDDVIYFSGMKGGHELIEDLFLKWLKKLQPDVAIVKVIYDQDGSSFGVKGKKKLTYKKALEELKGLSKRIETGISLSGSTKSVLAYLNENEVNPLERYQGIRHFDRVVLSRNPKLVEYFVDAGIDPNIEVIDRRLTPPMIRPLLIELDYPEALPLIEKLIKLGADPKVVEDGNINLLHRWLGESLHISKLLLEAGVDIHLRNFKGQTPLLQLADYKLHYYDPECDDLSESFWPYVDLMIEAGANIADFDDDGLGVLMYGQQHPDVCDELLRRFPQLTPHAPEISDEEAMVRKMRRRTRYDQFLESCIVENLLSPFEDQEFVDYLTPDDRENSYNCDSAFNHVERMLQVSIDHDRLPVVEKIHSMGYPMLSQIVNKNTYVYAQEKNALAVLEYFHKQGINEDTINTSAGKSENWLSNLTKQLETGSHPLPMCSEAWYETQKQIWERNKDLEYMTESDFTLEEYFTNRLQYLAKHPVSVERNIFRGLDIALFHPYGFIDFSEGEENALLYPGELLFARIMRNSQ